MMISYKKKFTIDHFIPKSKGGGDDLNNLVTSCRDCNLEKADKISEKYGNNTINI
jgi:5-methylcytosine-specific restriction endonuclease McrA